MSTVPEVIDLVIALLVTPEDFPGELGDNYPAACRALGLKPQRDGYGLLLSQDRAGGRWTQVTTDVEGLSSVVAIWNSGLDAGYLPPAGSVVATRPGWPVECPLSLEDRPPAHDPDVPGQKPFTPAPSTGWTPARRRQLADEIADELQAPPGDPYGEHLLMSYGETEMPPRRRLVEELLVQVEDLTAPPIRRAITEAWKLAAARDLPRGTIRMLRMASFTRMVRVNGDGWSLIARPVHGPAVLLLDELPGAAVDIAGVEGLQKLLTALTATDRR